MKNSVVTNTLPPVLHTKNPRVKLNILLLTCLISLSFHLEAQYYKDTYKPLGNLNKPEREEWLKDAGFGMFIHFIFDSQLGIVISHSMVGASEDYLDRFINELPKTFGPNKFDPLEYAKLAKLAGIKYVVLGAKHHSGYCLWDTKTTAFNIMNTNIFGLLLIFIFLAITSALS